MLVRSIALVLCLVPTFAFPAQVTVQRMEALIQSYVANQQFMGAVLVARGDSVLLDNGYGSADIAWGISNTPTTRFRIASVSKQFTAAAIMRLVDEGKLRLDDRLSDHLRPIAPSLAHIMLSQLLTHTSGMGDYLTSLVPHPASARTSAQTIESIQRLKLEAIPGTRYIYSNSGYAILGAVIEQASGMGYCQFIRERLVRPLGLHDTDCNIDTEVVPRRASGYLFERGVMRYSLPHQADGIFADGGLYSTVDDLWRWQKALYGGKVVSPGSLGKMTSVVKQEHGMGVEVNVSANDTVYGHAGHLKGFTSRISYRPRDELQIIVLSNMGMGYASGLAQRLRSLASGETVTLNSERVATEVDLPVLIRRVGAYQFPGEVVCIKLDQRRLLFRLGDQEWLALTAESASTFFTKTIDAQFEFVAGKNGRESLILHQNGQHILMPRIPDMSPAPRVPSCK